MKRPFCGAAAGRAERMLGELSVGVRYNAGDAFQIQSPTAS